MKIIISGITGFIGKELSQYFMNMKYDVFRISRTDISKGTEHLAHLINQADVVINLAGAPIIKRWTKKWKNEIFNSRINTTQEIVKAIKLLPEERRPKQLLSASAIGFYHPEGIHDEINYKQGDNFLANTCYQWEVSANEAINYGVTVKIMRFGIVLGTQGGAFPRLLSLFKKGLGGKVGSGKQGFPFIHIKDLVEAISFLIKQEEITGAFNFVAPAEINNEAFTSSLGKVLHRPTFFHVPNFTLKLMYGEGGSVLSEGPTVRPTRLLNAGFQFHFPNIDSCLADLCQNKKRE